MKLKRLRVLTALLLVCCLLMPYLPLFADFDEGGAEETAADYVPSTEAEIQAEPEEPARNETEPEGGEGASALKDAEIQAEPEPDAGESGSPINAASENTETPTEPIEGGVSNLPDAEIQAEPEGAAAAAFKQNITLNGVIVSVTAPAGVFPEGALLRVSDVPAEDRARVDAAVESQRRSTGTVAASYSFDIKVVDADGNELQPADSGSVQVSFSLAAVADGNLDTHVYHIKDEGSALSAQSLHVATQGSTATVVTDGFSYYTVEFTYGDLQYVMQGDGEMPLATILDALGLSGAVTAVEVSNPALFYAYRHDSGTWLVKSVAPFLSEEWMDVTIDGIVYRIAVTDDYIKMNASTSPTDVPGVIQGVGDNFTANMPIASIWIDESKVNITGEPGNEKSCRDTYTELVSINSDYSDFIYVAPAYQYGGKSSKFVFFDMAKAYAKDNNNIKQNQYNTFPNEIATFRIADGAELNATGDKLDVYIVYSNLSIVLHNGLSEANYKIMTGQDSGYKGYMAQLFYGNMIATGGKLVTSSGGINTTLPTTQNRYHYGFSVDVDIVIKSKTGSIVDGTFYYPAVDIDVNREQASSFQYLYGTDPSATPYDSTAHRYSEIIKLNKNYGDIYIPGGGYTGVYTSYTSNRKTYYTSAGEAPYISRIERVSNGDGTYSHLFYPGNNAFISNNAPSTAYWNGTAATDDIKNNTFYSGFATLATNTGGGLSLTAYSAACGSSANVETYLLAGSSRINYYLKATSGTGGKIQTTTSGNHAGTLLSGTIVARDTITTSAGQTIVYTMTPEPGYRIKSVHVINGTTDIDGTGTNGQNKREISLGTTAGTNYIYRDGVYTYEFNGIHEDNAIHVEWEPTVLNIEKHTVNPDTSTDFPFNIQVYKSIAAKNDTFKAVGAWSGSNDGSGTESYSLSLADSSYYPIYWNKNTFTWADAETNNAIVYTEDPSSGADGDARLKTWSPVLKSEFQKVDNEGTPSGTGIYLTDDTITINNVAYNVYVRVKDSGGSVLSAWPDLAADPGNYSAEFFVIDNENAVTVYSASESHQSEFAHMSYVDLSQAPANLTPSTTSANTYTFTLKSEKTKTLTGIVPLGYTYSIWEDSIPGWYMTTSSGDSGVMADSNPTASFTNDRFTPLTVTKKVSGGLGNKAKQWSFTLEIPSLAGSTGSTIEVSYKGTAAVWTLDFAGKISFTLGHDDTLIVYLPAGTAYTVSEETAAGYTQTYSIGGAAAVSGKSTGSQTLNAATTVTFNNELEGSPPTGVYDSVMPALWITALAAIGFTLIFTGRRRRADG